MKQIRTSTYLIVLAGCLLIVNLVMGVFVFKTVRFLINDASIINHIGIIRGSIQRITKVELAGRYALGNRLVQETDLLMRTLFSNDKQKLFGRKYAGIIKGRLQKITPHWRHLKNILADYRKAPSDSLLQQILQESETCWDIADNAVSQAQFATEDKIFSIRALYIILFIYGLNTLVLIWGVYTYVRKNLEYLAAHDALTGLFNRHMYKKQIEIEMERSKRYHHKLSLILLDIDYFKRVNDTHGHKAGDAILRDFGRIVGKTVRKNDSVFRVGGEEFVIIIPETGVENASIMAEKIRHTIENEFRQTAIPVTISLGVAEATTGQTPSELYRQVDIALYQAKNNGRNQFQVYRSTFKHVLS